VLELVEGSLTKPLKVITLTELAKVSVASGALSLQTSLNKLAIGNYSQLLTTRAKSNQLIASHLQNHSHMHKI
jgi:hypothetical protein